MSLVAIGCNHRSTPLDSLERMTVAPEELAKALADLGSAENLSEVVVLSTCNRVEIYALAERFHGGYHDVREFLCRHAGLPPEDVADHLYALHDIEAVRHLFSVVSGLDSAVIGEH
ncbi:MAG: glutamyl-tRNA reductase, partial [Acidimicrobiaceae bacterium]|nr:glutamyl-tRNA reductase [Acidimicrobiaceae bacterium]